MDGFKRPNRPMATPTVPSQLPEVKIGIDQDSLPEQSAPTPPLQKLEPLKPKKTRRCLWIASGAILLVIVSMIAGYGWYQGQLAPVNSADKTVQRVEIKESSTFSSITSTLKQRGLIRSELAFTMYAELHGKRGQLKAGTCSLTPSESVDELLTKLTSGCHDFVSITFYPGATLESSLYAKTKAQQAGKEFKDPSIRASLQAAGFKDVDISAAFAAQYTGPLFEGKPSTEGLEGYIFGETYYVGTGATVQEVLETAFGQMNTIVKQNDLVNKYKAQGLTLYQGITLASIIEKELDCEGKPTEERKNRCYGYQQQIAEVFYNRLAQGMSLGSDVTSIYASDKLGVAPSVDVDSPYNTRKYANLPPGPIATPGKLALLAAANPTSGNKLYFLAGDDGLIYFANDEAGHTANIKNHCQTLCGDL